MRSRKKKNKNEFENKFLTNNLEIEIIQPGDGRNFPKKGHIVTVHYTANVNNPPLIIMGFIPHFLTIYTKKQS